MIQNYENHPAVIEFENNEDCAIDVYIEAYCIRDEHFHPNQDSMIQHLRDSYKKLCLNDPNMWEYVLEGDNRSFYQQLTKGQFIVLGW